MLFPQNNYPKNGILFIFYLEVTEKPLSLQQQTNKQTKVFTRKFEKSLKKVCFYK